MIKLVQNDTKPSIYLVVEDPSTGEPIDLSGATVRMHFRAVGASALKSTVSGTLLAGYVNDDGTVDSAAPYNVDGAGGRVRIDWAPGDLDTPGHYEGEVQVTFADTTKQTTYRTLSFYVRPEFA